MISSDLILDSDLDDIIDGLPREVECLAGKRILIAGGAGFLGRYFLAVFKRLNVEVLASPCKLSILDNFRVADKALVGDIGNGASYFMRIYAVMNCRRNHSIG